LSKVRDESTHRSTEQPLGRGDRILEGGTKPMPRASLGVRNEALSGRVVG